MKMLDNRDYMRKLAGDDWKNGRISDDVGHTLMFVFHRDFKNFFDYVPPERQEYTSQMNKLDSSFWKHYRIRPDFVLPADMVYQLYKAYIIEHKDEYPAINQR
ncbi:MAG: hypothetical protein K2M12_01220 [Muribaculaceae bacterium]|nr:hypothetical protein [Muribaculaceae bacterium]